MTEIIPIPLNRPPQLLAPQLLALQAVLASDHTHGNGGWGKRCEAQLGKLFCGKVLMTTSGTHALEVAALLLDITPGDEVIVPSFGFSSTANAFALRGAKIRFAEIDGFGNIDLLAVEQLISSRTKLVVPIHYGGGACRVDALISLCKSANVSVVADAAQAIGAKYLGRPLGAWCDLGALSFHSTKNLSAGEGGCLVLNSPRYLESAQFIREKGTNRAHWGAGLVDKYTWVSLGSSYVLSELNAAYLYPQLEQLDAITERRVALWNRYASDLGPALESLGWDWVRLPPDCETNGHLFAVLAPSQEQRDRLIFELKEQKIGSAFHYGALHRSPFGSRFAEPKRSLPVTDRFSTCLVRLPLYYDLANEEQTRVIDTVRSVIKGLAKRYGHSKRPRLVEQRPA